MKILMLGWEYPPHIAGGLGTACEGLTDALSRRDIGIHFVVPHLFGGESARHMVLTDSDNNKSVTSTPVGSVSTQPRSVKVERRVSTVRIPAFLGPYWTPDQFRQAVAAITEQRLASLPALLKNDEVIQALVNGEVYGVDLLSAVAMEEGSDAPDDRYGVDIFEEVDRFTARVLQRMSGEHFDIIHAHDWMTFPAGVALAQATGKPLVIHVHSLEYDRSGLFINEQINQIERFGLEAATRVITVSYYSKKAIEKYHTIPPEKITVVHNGVYPRHAVQNYRLQKTWPRNVVLFLGRVTFQKGPDYFVEVATRVIPHVPDVLFVLAGAGDMLPRLKERVEQLGLLDNFLFPGFVHGEELEEMFSVADLYVMPSVSEPFGISALEALSFETPVIISKQSGVAEVLDSALKVNFWDLDRMADLIINSLLHEELRRDMIEAAREEVRRLHWDAAAAKTLEVYQELSGHAR